MHDSVATRKYARAIFEQARATQQILACQQGLEEFVRILSRKASLKDVVNHPFISSDEKKHMIHSAFGEFATPLLERFLYMLVRRHRFDLLPLILREFQDEVDRYQNVQPLRVRTAFPMSEPQRQKLQASLEKWLGSKVRMEIQSDPSLIGGLVIQTRDCVLDQSLKGRLKKLQQQLSA